ncbi:uncharacterized protein LOC130668478 [Microplitis mediator]|uniref:uncharacterized protein LOC130668478 n=1 Tax=Microplitis mediator TaxID=375433 RepID=UPI00255417EF|nr:uncharacterized protein LOC130668478 [Microplitis mediator]
MNSKINAVLFDPGGSDISYGCSRVSALKAKAYGSKVKANDNCNDNSKLIKPKYSPKVFEGNWFEERIKSTPTTQKDQSNLNTSTQNDSKSRVKKSTRQAFEIARENKERNKGSGNLLFDQEDNSYLNNFTTSYDLTYRVIPQGLDGPRLRSYNGRINKWLPEQDLTKNFGNLTGYGMTEYLRALEQELNYEGNDKPRTHYQCDYTKKKLPVDSKRFHRKRIDLNTPDLSAFNIDLNKCWARTLTHGFQKNNLCQRVACGQY